MKAQERNWGIWLRKVREWQELPPRLCKPTPYNTNLCPALLDVLRQSASDGNEPELKQIPKDTLSAMRKEYQ